MSSALPIGLAIRQAREPRGLTLAEVSRRSGVARSVLQRIEAGGGFTIGGPCQTLERVADALGMSVGALVSAAEALAIRQAREAVGGAKILARRATE